jgi:hypothetical protein
VFPAWTVARSRRYNCGRKPSIRPWRNRTGFEILRSAAVSRTRCQNGLTRQKCGEFVYSFELRSFSLLMCVMTRRGPLRQSPRPPSVRRPLPGIDLVGNRSGPSGGIFPACQSKGLAIQATRSESWAIERQSDEPIAYVLRQTNTATTAPKTMRRVGSASFRYGD